MKANSKQLKAALALGVRKLVPLFLALKLVEFPLFNNYLDLANFWDLDVFWFSNLPIFGSTHFDLSLNLLLPLQTSLTSLTAYILA